MDRLTRRNEKGIAVLNIRCPEWCEHATYSPEEGYQCQRQCEGDIIDKLAIYEDAEEQGLLLRLPAPLDGVERFSLDGGKTIWQRVYETDMTEEETDMTENEAKYILIEIMELDDSMAQYNLAYMKAMEVAIKALEEVQQYREIGTPEDLKAMKEHGAFTGVELANIAAMQSMLRDYQQIGTLDECRAAMTVKKEVQEIVDRQLVAGKNNYKETYDCFWEIVKVVQANY